MVGDTIDAVEDEVDGIPSVQGTFADSLSSPDAALDIESLATLLGALELHNLAFLTNSSTAVTAASFLVMSRYVKPLHDAHAGLSHSVRPQPSVS